MMKRKYVIINKSLTILQSRLRNLKPTRCHLTKHKHRVFQIDIFEITFFVNNILSI